MKKNQFYYLVDDDKDSNIIFSSAEEAFIAAIDCGLDLSDIKILELKVDKVLSPRTIFEKIEEDDE